MIIGFVFVEVEDVVVAAGAEAFGVYFHFSFTSFAGLDFGFPIYFFVAGVAEAFGMMFFFLITVDTCFDYHLARKKRSHIKYFVLTGYFRSFNNVRTDYYGLCELFVH